MRLRYGTHALVAAMATAVLVGCDTGPDDPRDSERTEEIVVAEVDGSFVYLSDVGRLAVGKELVETPDAFTPDSADYAEVRDEVIDQRVLSNLARTQGLHRTEEFYRRSEIAETRILGNLAVEAEIDRVVTEDAIRALYDQQLALREPVPQVRGRTLLVKTREEAEAAIAEVEEGENFADIAARVSLDADTAASGGELDWFNRKTYDAAITDAAFATEPGNMTVPVETDDGWRVILVEDVREDEVPTLEQLREEITGFLRYEAVQALLNTAREAATIELRDTRGDVSDAVPDEADGGAVAATPDE